MTVQPETPEPDAYDPRDAMFPDGAPDVGVGGVSVLRATITSLDSDDGADSDAPRIGWHISGFPGDAGTPVDFVLIGDLTCSGGGWFAATTATCHLSFKEQRSFDPDDLDTINALARTYGAWTANLLYDTAASRARSLIASVTGCDLEIPVITAEPHFGRVVRREDAEVVLEAAERGAPAASDSPQ